MNMAHPRHVILNFHGIGPPHSSVLENEKAYWLSKDRFRAIVEQAAERRNAGSNVKITFDDGNRSDVDTALAVLTEFGFSAEFFLLTARLGRPHYLGPADIQNLVHAGMEVGLHGHDHVDWRALSEKRLNTETVWARKRLEGIVGKSVDKVSVPFGAYNRRVIARLKAETFGRIYTSDGGTAPPCARIQSRNSVRSDMTTATIETLLTKQMPVVSRLRRSTSIFLRTWVV